MTLTFDRDWYHTDLAAHRPGFYSASVRPSGDRWLFRAFPHRGDWVVEFIDSDGATVADAADRWFRGETVEGVYSASF